MRDVGEKSECYTVKACYRAIGDIYNTNNNDGKWKKIWNKDGLPKINVFFWIPGHGKYLTTNNLRKEAWKAHRDAFSVRSVKSPFNTFFKSANSPGRCGIKPRRSCNLNWLCQQYGMIFFARWKDYYLGSLLNKPNFARAYEALLRYICWKIWTARTKKFFMEKRTVLEK